MYEFYSLRFRKCLTKCHHLRFDSFSVGKSLISSLVVSPLVNLGFVSQIQSELGVIIIKTRMNGRFRIGVVGEKLLSETRCDDKKVCVSGVYGFRL